MAADPHPAAVVERLWASRVGRPHLGQTSITLPAAIGWAMSRIPPCCTLGMRSVVPELWRGLVCRLAMFTPSTTIVVALLPALRR